MRFLRTILYRQDEGGGGGDIVEPPAPAEPPTARNTLMDDLLKERNKRKEAEKALAAEQAKVTAAEQAQLSENEQLKARLAAAEATAADLATQAAKTTKAALVRAAAKDFHDAEDAIALLDTRGLLSDIDDSSDAERAVKQLAKDRPHLVKAPAGTQGSIQQILENGLGVVQQQSAGDSSTYSFAELKGMSPAQMREARSTPEGRAKVDRSMTSLKASV